MFALAAGKGHVGRRMGNPVLVTEGRVTWVDGLLASAVLVGLVLNAALGMVVGRPRGRTGDRGLRDQGGTRHPLGWMTAAMTSAAR